MVNHPSIDETTTHEFLAPDTGGWHYTILRDWIAVCPDISSTAARVYWIVRSVMLEKGDRSRRLSYDQIAWLLPDINAKPTSIDRVKRALRELETVGLVSNPDGDIQRRWTTDPTTGQQTRDNYRRWQIHDYPATTAHYDGWKSALAKLDDYPGPGWRQESAPTEGAKKPSQARPAKTRTTPGHTGSAKKPSQSQHRDQAQQDKTPGHAERAFLHTKRAKKLAHKPLTSENSDPKEPSEGTTTNQLARASATAAAPTEPDQWDNDGWLVGNVSEEPTSIESTASSTSPGWSLLQELGISGQQRRTWAPTVDAGLEQLGEHKVRQSLTGGRQRPGTGAIIDTRLPALYEQIQVCPTSANPLQIPDWCGECGDPSDDRRALKCRNNPRMRVWHDGTLCWCATPHEHAA